MMDLESVQLFLDVVRLGSLSRAADESYVSKSMVKRRMDSLEEEVGTALLARGPRGIEVTPAGAVFLERSKKLFASIDETKTLCADAARRSAQRTLRVAQSSDYVFPIFQYLMDAYSAKYPSDVVIPVFSKYSRFYGSLREGLFDLAVVPRPSATDSIGLSSTVFYVMRMCGLVAQGSELARKATLTRSDLAATHVVIHPMWCPKEDLAAWSTRDEVRFEVETNDDFSLGMQRTCIQGGIYLFPDTDIERLPYKAIPLEDPIDSYVAAVYPVDFSPAVTDFIGCTREFLEPFIDPSSRRLIHDWGTNL